MPQRGRRCFAKLGGFQGWSAKHHHGHELNIWGAQLSLQPPCGSENSFVWTTSSFLLKFLKCSKLVSMKVSSVSIYQHGRDVNPNKGSNANIAVPFATSLHSLSPLQPHFSPSIQMTSYGSLECLPSSLARCPIHSCHLCYMVFSQNVPQTTLSQRDVFAMRV